MQVPLFCLEGVLLGWIVILRGSRCGLHGGIIGMGLENSLNLTLQDPDFSIRYA